mmetsp:Transcript_10234/g.62488  ORF Transcript_10234/g.62488 Transcript_10234/m.62488 type:complete len:249 (+) Transcript_10234:4324-5070(+)
MLLGSPPSHHRLDVRMKTDVYTCGGDVPMQVRARTTMREMRKAQDVQLDGWNAWNSGRGDACGGGEGAKDADAAFTKRSRSDQAYVRRPPRLPSRVCHDVPDREDPRKTPQVHAWRTCAFVRRRKERSDGARACTCVQLERLFSGFGCHVDVSRRGRPKPPRDSHRLTSRSCDRRVCTSKGTPRRTRDVFAREERRRRRSDAAWKRRKQRKNRLSPVGRRRSRPSDLPTSCGCTGTLVHFTRFGPPPQ